METSTPIPSWTTTKTPALQTGTTQHGKNGDLYCSKAHSCCMGYVDISKRILSFFVKEIPTVEYLFVYNIAAFYFLFRSTKMITKTLFMRKWVIHQYSPQWIEQSMVSLCVHISCTIIVYCFGRAFKFTFRCSTWYDTQMCKTLISNWWLLVCVMMIQPSRWWSNLILSYGLISRFIDMYSHSNTK